MLGSSSRLHEVMNGSTPFRHKFLLANSRCGDAVSPLHTSNHALADPNAPYNASVVLDNFFGWTFNGLNDVEVLKGGEGGEAVFFLGAL